MLTKTINVYSTAQFPCPWDDLIIRKKIKIKLPKRGQFKEKNKNKLIATIYTEKEAKKRWA